MRLLRFWKSYTPSGERKARGAAGGQHVVGAGAVVAQAFAGVSAQEDRAGVAQQRLPAVWVGAADLQVLGRDAVADGAGLFHAARVGSAHPGR